MTELSLNILDIANNSTRAKAKNITISVQISTIKDDITIKIIDDGCGMSEEFVAKINDPFTTTRTTRKVGMGIPLYKMIANQCGGDVEIVSTLGVGTTVTANFMVSSVDRPPLGDLGATFATLVGGAPEIDFKLIYSYDDENYTITTQEIKSALGEEDLSDVVILNYLQEMINENLQTIKTRKAKGGQAICEQFYDI